MNEVLSIACDNPSCRSVDLPEYVPWIEQDRKRRKTDKITPPYGWCTLTGDIIGSGPNIDVTVCSIDCVEPAIREALWKHYEWDPDKD